MSNKSYYSKYIFNTGKACLKASAPRKGLLRSTMTPSCTVGIPILLPYALQKSWVTRILSTFYAFSRLALFQKSTSINIGNIWTVLGPLAGLPPRRPTIISLEGQKICISNAGRSHVIQSTCSGSRQKQFGDHLGTMLQMPRSRLLVDIDDME